MKLVSISVSPVAQGASVSLHRRIADAAHRAARVAAEQEIATIELETKRDADADATAANAAAEAQAAKLPNCDCGLCRIQRAERDAEKARAERDAHSPAEVEAAETESLAHRIEALVDTAQNHARAIEALEIHVSELRKVALAEQQRADRANGRVDRLERFATESLPISWSRSG